ncbi:unnamed protein product, partial [marine sediment metagenome]
LEQYHHVLAPEYNPLLPNLEGRLKEIKEHKYDKEIEEFMHMDRESIKKKYYARDIEKM